MEKRCQQWPVFESSSTTKLGTAVFLFVTLTLFCMVGRMCAHDDISPATDEEVEVSDYLQVFALLGDGKLPGSEAALKQWVGLRDDAWAFRKRVDGEENLDVASDPAKAQIAQLNARRAQWLASCKAILEVATRTKPTIRVKVEARKLSFEGAPQAVTSATGVRDGVALALTNATGSSVEIKLAAEYADGIWVQAKTLRLTPGETRYVMAYLDSPTPGKVQTTLTLSVARRTLKVPIQAMFEGADLTKAPEAPQDDAPPPGGRIKARIFDAATGDPVAARVEIRGADGKAYCRTRGNSIAVAVDMDRVGYTTPLWGLQTGAYFYAEGAFELDVNPGPLDVRVYKGFEYQPFQTNLTLAGKQVLALDCPLTRWVDMPRQGWYSGQTHIHTILPGIPVLFTPYWPIVPPAEGLNVSHILTLKGAWPYPKGEWAHRTNVHTYADEYPMGPVRWASGRGTDIFYGEEYRNNTYGHVCFLDIRELVDPITTGLLGELGGPDYPPNVDACDAARAQGGTTIAAHFNLNNQHLQLFGAGQKITTVWSWTNLELPIDIALGKIDVAEIYGVKGGYVAWYKYLNCGFRLPAAAGPDWWIRDCPRVYAKVAGSYDPQKWLAAVKQGRSFVTQGPMLFFTVDEHDPGEIIRRRETPAKLRVKATALALGKPVAIEIVANGQVVQQGEGKVDAEISIERSSWLAARCGAAAHTSPIYVYLGKQPIVSKMDADDFIRLIDRLADWVNTKAVFENGAQKDRVLGLCRQGRAVYEKIAAQADDVVKREAKEEAKP